MAGRGSAGCEPIAEPEPPAAPKAKAKGGRGGERHQQYKGSGKHVSQATVRSAAASLTAESCPPGHWLSRRAQSAPEAPASWGPTVQPWAGTTSYICGIGGAEGPCPPAPSSRGKSYYLFRPYPGEPEPFVCVGQQVALRYTGGRWVGHSCGCITGFEDITDAINASTAWSHGDGVEVRWR